MPGFLNPVCGVISLTQINVIRKILYDCTRTLEFVPLSYVVGRRVCLRLGQLPLCRPDGTLGETLCVSTGVLRSKLHPVKARVGQTTVSRVNVGGRRVV